MNLDLQLKKKIEVNLYCLAISISMERKKVIELKEFIETLKKHKCKFRKIAGIYPANCNGIKYVGQKIDFKKVEVFQLEDKEAELIKKVMLLFPDGEIMIKKD